MKQMLKNNITLRIIIQNTISLVNAKMSKQVIIVSVLFFFQLFLDAKIVTNSPRCDGFGSQYLVLIGSVINAERHNAEFHYTPLIRMEHNYNNNPAFLKKKEWLINFIGNFPLAASKLPYAQCNYHHEARGGEIIACSKSLQKIKNIFRLNKNISDYVDTKRFNIVIHVRRPNAHDNRVYGTDVPDQFFLEIIRMLRIKYKNNNPIFHIFSQGEIANFAAYKTDDTLLRINETIEDAFSTMVFADMLVAAQSAFSYVAGLLSEGSVYYIPFSCKPLPHWTSVYDLLHVSNPCYQTLVGLEKN